MTWSNATGSAILSVNYGHHIAGLWTTIASSLAVLVELVVWIAVLKTAKLKNASNYVVLNLSFADLLVDLLNAPVVVASLLGGYVPSNRACQLLGMINMSTFVGTVMSLVLISINRWGNRRLLI